MEYLPFFQSLKEKPPQIYLLTLVSIKLSNLAITASWHQHHGDLSPIHH